MFPITIYVDSSVISVGGTVQPILYGKLGDSYVPKHGPSKGKTLASGQWVYYTGDDYAAVTNSVPLPSFSEYSGEGSKQVNLPDVFSIRRILFLA